MNKFKGWKNVFSFNYKQNAGSKGYIIITALVAVAIIAAAIIISVLAAKPEENEENTAWILENLPFKKKEIASVLPEVLKHDCVENQIQLLPGIHPCDGFFIAAFEREA